MQILHYAICKLNYWKIALADQDSMFTGSHTDSTDVNKTGVYRSHMCNKVTLSVEESFVNHN